MTEVITLMCHSEQSLLHDDLLRQLERTLGTAPTVLATGIAAEFYYNNTARTEIKSQIIPLINGKDIDFALQNKDGREKNLLIADMDSTIIQQECLDELAAFVGKKAEVAEITERAMNGEIDFENALIERVALLEGLHSSVLQKTLDHHLSLTHGAIELVQTMNARGAMTALVSGGFTFFTHRISQAVGFVENQGNILEIVDEHLTGKVILPILGKEAKREALETICEFEGLAVTDTMAVGDGANDLAMLKKAGTGVAFHAKPSVAAQADVQINHSDLTALLYLQGIPASEFAKA